MTGTTELQSDQAIVAGLLTGDAQAWAALYAQYSVPIWKYIGRLVGSDASSVGDIVQETFMAAARSGSQFDASRGTLWAWLSGIAQHQVSSHWKHAARVRRIEEAVEHIRAGSEAEYQLESEPAAVVERQELRVVIRAVLAELQEDYSVLLAAKYCDGLSVGEIQEQLGGSTEAIRSRLARARREFRRLFERRS